MSKLKVIKRQRTWAAIKDKVKIKQSKKKMLERKAKRKAANALKPKVPIVKKEKKAVKKKE